MPAGSVCHKRPRSRAFDAKDWGRDVRIGVDGYNLALPNPTGVGVYGFNLTETVAAMGHQTVGVFGLAVGKDPALREVLFFDRLSRKEHWTTRRRLTSTASFVKAGGRRTAVDVPIVGSVERRGYANRLPEFDRVVSAPWLFATALRVFALTGRFLTLSFDNPPDVMHWTYPLPIRLNGARNVYTLHDLVPLRLPFATLDEKRRYHELCRQCVERADHVLTVSEASRTDILDRYDLSPDAITNTYQASRTDASASGDDDADLIEGVFGVRRRGYFLFFGAIEPKKNVGRIIEAHLSTQTETPLIIVGKHGWETERELRLLPESKGMAWTKTLGRSRVLQVDSLPRPMLERLIRGARAVLFPSLYEGFGLPVLEAMQLGTPVLTSNTSSLPEVAGEAAITVDPYDVGAIAAGLRRLDADDGLRDRMSDEGREQARSFTQARYAERLADVYRRMGLG